MTKIKLCGLSRETDIEAANRLQPDYIGFVFAKNSRRFVSSEQAEKLKSLLMPTIKAVGVFVNEEAESVAELLNRNVIDIAQLHGDESEEYLHYLRTLTDKPIFKAFRIDCADDVALAGQSSADCILLDAGAGGTGNPFDWRLIKDINRPFFLAGGLNLENIKTALKEYHPFGVDVSSGIESDGYKDNEKMNSFVKAVRAFDRKEL